MEGIEAVTGPSLPTVPRLAVSDGADLGNSGAAWALRGLASNARYTRRGEQEALAARQAELGRPEATRAALIPITKSEAWWALAQDERRELFEETSHHIAIGLEYLPAIARRLHHGRDLGEAFDFLTWFEYAPQDAPAFEDLVSRLRATPEWDYVERKIDIRLALSRPPAYKGILYRDVVPLTTAGGLCRPYRIAAASQVAADRACLAAGRIDRAGDLA